MTIGADGVAYYPWNHGEVLTAAALNAAINLGQGSSGYVNTAPPASPLPGALWFDPVSVQLYVWYNDGTSSQWVVAVNPPAGNFLPLSGGTLVGPLLLSSDGTTPSNVNSAVSKAYVDGALGGVGPFLPLSGGQLSGVLGLPNGTLAAPSLAIGAVDGTGLSRNVNALVVGVQNTLVLGMFAGNSQFYTPLSMLNNKITQLADATAAGDALNQRSGDARYTLASTGPFLPLSGGTVSGQVALPFINIGNDNTVDWSNHTATGANYGGPLLVLAAHTSGSALVPGNFAGGVNLNWIAIPWEQVNYPGNQGVNGLAINHNFGGGNATGGRQALQVSLEQVAGTQSHAAGINPFFVGGTFYAYANASEGGANPPTSGSQSGQLFGLNAWGRLKPGATGFTSVVGAEINWSANSGSSYYWNAGLMLVLTSDHAVHGTANIDAGMVITAQPGIGTGLDYGISFSSGAQWPLSASGTLIFAGTGNTTNGIDFSATTFSGSSLKMPGFLVSGTGHVSMHAGADFGATVAATMTDLSHHIDLYNNQFGFSVTAGTLNYVAPVNGWHVFYAGSTVLAYVTGTGGIGATLGLGLFGTSPVAIKPTVTGSKGANSALASLITALAAYGLFIDNTT